VDRSEDQGCLSGQQLDTLEEGSLGLSWINLKDTIMSDVNIQIEYVWSTNDDGDFTVGIDVNGRPTTPEFVFNQKTVIDGIYEEFEEAEDAQEIEDVANEWILTAARLRAMANAIEVAVQVNT
jgi:hypothetical protein